MKSRAETHGKGAAPALRPLDQLAPGERGVIERLDGDPSIRRRLMELGLVPGTDVLVVRHAPLGDPVELHLRQIHLSIRRAEAANIHVRAR